MEMIISIWKLSCGDLRFVEADSPADQDMARPPSLYEKEHGINHTLHGRIKVEVIEIKEGEPKWFIPPQS